MSKGPVKLITLGLGQRGCIYSDYVVRNPQDALLVGVADPADSRRRRFLDTVPSDYPAVREWSDWQEVIEEHDSVGHKICDGVMICTQDHLHAEMCIEFSRRGYHILCEKPLSTTRESCEQIAAAVLSSGVLFLIGHVLRYSPHNAVIGDLLRQKKLGTLVSINHTEPVGYTHFAHSYVRGNWRQEEKGVGSLLTKCCHDLDICNWYVKLSNPNLEARQVYSKGSLEHFKRSKKPREAGTAKRCVECAIKDTCPYSATRIYLGAYESGVRGFPIENVVDDVSTIHPIQAAIEDGPYGVCVYEHSNNVCDNQTVLMDFNDEETDETCTVSLTMVAFSKHQCLRQTQIYGSHGEICSDSVGPVRFTDFRTGITHSVETDEVQGGHGGGDKGIMRAFIAGLRKHILDGVGLDVVQRDIFGVDVKAVLEAHQLVFEAEESRKKRIPVTHEIVGVRQMLANTRLLHDDIL